MPIEATFSYSTAPLPVKPRKKYREDEDEPTPMMGDPRIVRGNTHAMARNIATMKKDAQQQQQQQEKTTRTITAKNAQKNRDVKSISLYSYEVPEFVSPEVNLSLYLIDHDSIRRSVKEVETQVDDFVVRPVTPEYVPRKTGIDRQTQVEDVRDLFNFDAEVSPMLEVIVKKTLEQSLFELQAEAELLALEEAVVKFSAEKEEEIEWQREKEREYLAEVAVKQNHLKSLRIKLDRQREVKRKVAGTRCMKELFPGMLEEVCAEFFKENIWKVQQKEDMTKRIVPKIVQEAGQRIGQYASAAQLLDELLLSAAAAYNNTPEFVPPPPPRPLTIRLILLADSIGTEEDVELSPLQVTEKDTVGAVEERFQAELRRRGIELPPFPLGLLVTVLRQTEPLALYTPLSYFAFVNDSVEIKY